MKGQRWKDSRIQHWYVMWFPDSDGRNRASPADDNAELQILSEKRKQDAVH